MPKLPEYPPEIRKRAIELIEETHEDGRRKYSYSQVIAKLREEFPDNERVQTLSKSTLTRWYREHRKQQKQAEETPKEEPKEETAPEPKEKPTADTDNIPAKPEELPAEFRKMEYVSTDFVVNDIQKAITEVPDGALVKEDKQTTQPKTEEAVEQKESGFGNRTKIIIAVAGVIITGVVIYMVYRWWKRRKEFPTQEQHSEPREEPRPAPDEQYKKVTHPGEFEESDYGFAGMEVLP